MTAGLTSVSAVLLLPPTTTITAAARRRIAVPAGVTSVRVTVVGAAGGPAGNGVRSGRDGGSPRASSGHHCCDSLGRPSTPKSVTRPATVAAAHPARQPTAVASPRCRRAPRGRVRLYGNREHRPTAWSSPVAVAVAAKVAGPRLSARTAVTQPEQLARAQAATAPTSLPHRMPAVMLVLPPRMRLLPSVLEAPAAAVAEMVESGRPDRAAQAALWWRELWRWRRRWRLDRRIRWRRR